MTQNSIIQLMFKKGAFFEIALIDQIYVYKKNAKVFESILEIWINVSGYFKGFFVTFESIFLSAPIS